MVLNTVYLKVLGEVIAYEKTLLSFINWFNPVLLIESSGILYFSPFITEVIDGINGGSQNKYCANKSNKFKITSSSQSGFKIHSLLFPRSLLFIS